MGKGRLDHFLVVIAVSAQVQAAPVNFDRSHSTARASRSNPASHLGAIVRLVHRFVPRLRAVIPAVRQVRADRKTSLTEASPLRIKVAGRMPMASGLVTRGSVANRDLNARAGKALHTTDPDSKSPVMTVRSQEVLR